MNREIKFRGKTIPYKEGDFEYFGEWVYGFYHVDHNGNAYIIEDKPTGRVYPGVRVIAESVGQYTGLKDKNDVEIYEGNIIQNPRNDWGVIVYVAPFFEVTISETQSSMYSREYFQDVVIIGNKHLVP